MLRRSLGIVVVLVLSAAVGCTTTAPFITGLTGLPPSITIPATVVLTATGGPGSSTGLWTWIFSTTCGGTFTSTTTPNNGPANPITIGPTDAKTVQVTYDSTGATPGPCTFTVKLVTASGRSATLSVTTTIDAQTLTVTKTGTGTGTVTSSPPGINCGTVCVAGFDDGTVVTLTATPEAGSKFDGWSGDPDCSDGQVTMDADKTCTATFTLLTAGLSLTKVDAPDPVTYGSNVTYTLTVTNNGPDPATNVTLTDTLPTNVIFVSATPSQGTCSGTTTITCNLGTINNGANATVTVVVQAKATGIDLVVDDDTGTCAYTGTVTDTASVTADEHDPDLANNSASADTTVNKNHSTIGAAIAAASAGQKIFVCPGTYNESLIIAKALTITGAGIASVTINPTTTGYGIDISGAGSNVTLEQFTLNAGNSRNFMIHVSGVSNFTIQNAKLVGAGRLVLPGGSPLGGVDLINVTTALIKSVEVQDVSRNGISFTSSTGVTIDSANVHDTGVSTGWAGIAAYATTGTTSATFAGNSTVTNTPMGLYVEDLAGTTVNLSLSSGITFSGQAVAPIVRYGLGTVPGLEATGKTAAFAEALGLIARLTAPEFPVPPANTGAAFFYTVTDALAAAIADPGYAPYAVVFDLAQDEFFVCPGMKIQRAVNASAAGDTINLTDGTYTEYVTISGKSNLTIQSEAMDASKVTVTYASPPSPWAVFAIRPGSSGITIQHLTITSNNELIDVDSAPNCKILHNVLSATAGGAGRGVLVAGPSDNLEFAYNNLTKANGTGLWAGAWLPYWPTPPSNVSIHHNSIHHCSGAIEFRGVNGASIANNTITNNATAVGLYGAVGDPSITNRNISILGNTISQNTGKGIFGDGYNAPSPGVITVSGNTFSNNTDDGVYFQYNIQFVIDGNEILGSKRGIRLYNSSDNLIENNYIHDNSEYGVLIRGNSDRNKCLSNRISSNPVGIRNEPWGADTPENNEAHSNNISGNTNFGVSNGATGLFDATNNWWGDASGPLDTTGTNEVPPCTADPTTELNADGTGDKVSDNVDYCPWATTPF